MSLDVKFEVFSCHIFRHFFTAIYPEIALRDVRDLYREERLSESDYEDACSGIYISAVKCLSVLTNYSQTEFINNSREEYSESLSDFYDFIIRACNRQDFFGSLTIFERMLSTVEFVMGLGMCCFVNSIHFNTSPVLYIPLSWAMYFDRHSQEFYEQGGWTKLKEVALLYDYLSNSVHRLFALNYRFKVETTIANRVNECVENVLSFQKTLTPFEYKNLVKSWVKFSIQNRKNSCNRNRENPVNISILGMNLISICDNLLREQKKKSESNLQSTMNQETSL
ncbi:uncharacterized protein CEXT_472161 [Caerostris extrusa]|uniref:Uncharacterized protein n=1 Tax=Caerostris extrusa TaxID=172846 RepID=A0AAV4UVB3_CAEEX|nr:uncharacterized protein CEXT_472161 [Caerostris extrusa]